MIDLLRSVFQKEKYYADAVNAILNASGPTSIQPTSKLPWPNRSQRQAYTAGWRAAMTLGQSLGKDHLTGNPDSQRGYDDGMRKLKSQQIRAYYATKDGPIPAPHGARRPTGIS